MLQLVHMLITSLLGWWYGSGWKKLGQVMVQKLMASEDFFSIDLLAGTLFAPFRQISADTGRGGTLQMKMQAAFDKLFSRFVGMMVRSILIVTGIVWLFIQAVVDIVILLAWPLLPIAPLLGLVLSLMGWLPWKM